MPFRVRARSRLLAFRLLTLAVAIPASLAFAATAEAKLPASLHDPVNCARLAPAEGFHVYRCDDGVPEAGGTTPNPGGALAVTVPARYAGYKGLPRRAADAAGVPGADDDGSIALDVDVTLPARRAPRGGFPLLFLMHGCCGGSKTSGEKTTFDGEDARGEGWHYNNAWFAARGYVVVTYTSRGFVDRENRGSTGQMQLQSRSYEINDYQSLACQLHAAAPRFRDVTGKRVAIDPRRIVTTSGSYGGGYSWMALTDPRWRCAADTGADGTVMSLVATAPKFGWTDLVYALAPTGTHRPQPRHLPAVNGCDSGPFTLGGKPCRSPPTPVGIPKRSIVAALYATGKTGLPTSFTHTTFPPKVDEGILCAQGPYPPQPGPLCDSTIGELFPEFLRERSAYYQNRFFRTIARRPGWRVPVFDAAGLTDPLFPSNSDRTMINRLRSVVPRYPIKAFFGDYQHFTQNKAFQWEDVCGTQADHHTCTQDDYPRGDFNARPRNLLRAGITSRLNRFIDHYARPPASRRQRAPRFNVAAELQTCPQNAGKRPLDLPGPRFVAPTFERLAPDALDLRFSESQVTTSVVVPNLHALRAEPVFNQQTNGRACPVETSPAGPGIATYTSDPLSEAKTMIGSTRVTARFQPSSAPGLQLNARLYDVFPDGTAVMADRGPRRITDTEAAEGKVTFALHGNGWRFPRGHRIRIELAQDDDPYLRSSTIPSSLTLHGVRLRIPVRDPR